MVQGINGFSGNISQMKAQLESKLTLLGVPSDVISQGATAIEEYCEANDITLPKVANQGTLSFQSIFNEEVDSLPQEKNIFNE
jgi:hypothetical protein